MQKPLTFDDAYGLTLIARALDGQKGIEIEEVKKHLSESAKKLATKIERDFAKRRGELFNKFHRE